MKHRPFLLSLILFCWMHRIVAQQMPNYALVFPENQVNTLEIAISKADWDSIQVDMKNKFHTAFGQMGKGMFGPRDGQAMPPDRPQGMPQGEKMGEGPLRLGNDTEPRYVEAQLSFKGKQWTKVGFRLKGNSSLMSSWGQGIYKFPFRLDFGKYEKNTFWGFTEVSMSPAFHDASLVREKLASDIFREAGIATARTAFYKVYINFGEGKKYLGIYTMVEVIDDTMIKTQFGSDSGNIYKPESNFQRFVERQFEKKNHKKQHNWNDVQAFIKALNDSTRLQQPALWRANLEKTFDVNYFLKWLAVNTAMSNWDTYGAMAHNFYLYNAPQRGFVWIPWDNNEAMSDNSMPPPFMAQNNPTRQGEPPQGLQPSADQTHNSPRMNEGTMPPRQGGGPMMGRSLALDLKNVPSQFVLITYLIADPVYGETYKRAVAQFRKQTWQVKALQQRITTMEQLLKPWVMGDEQETPPYSHLSKPSDFATGIQALKDAIEKRAKLIDSFLLQEHAK